MRIFGNKIQHISAYELIIEQGTPISHAIENGIVPPPLQTDEFFDITHDVLASCGFEMYEVSNYAKFGFQGQHNISYWKYEDYYGIGPGAHSRLSDGKAKIAIEQEKNPQKWLIWAENPVFIHEKLTDQEIIEEKMIMGLRAICGVDEEDFAKISNYRKKISNLMENLYIIYSEGKFIMTYEGLKRLNLVIGYILGD